MSKILMRKVCLCALLLFCVYQSNAQCYTKEFINGKEIIKGTSEYIYFRSEMSYIGMTFTLIKDIKELYNLEVICDATDDFAAPDSLILQIENSLPIGFALKPGITSIVDGDLQRSILQLNLPLQSLRVLQEHNVINVTAYRGAKKLDLPVYDELFLRQQFNCLGRFSNSGK